MLSVKQENSFQPVHSYAPFDLHRIPDDVKYFPADITKSQAKGTKELECCITSAGFVPKNGINWSSSDKLTDVKGISTFRPFDNDAALVAAHVLFSEDGAVLRCNILQCSSTIDSIQFVNDRIFPAKPCAHHITITPTMDVSRDYFDGIAKCQIPTNWQPCAYTISLEGKAADSVDEVLPEPPDDELLCLACNALEDYALDCSMPPNMRFAARLAQFSLSTLSEWSELRTQSYLCELVEQSLKLWESGGFEAFSIARRGMLRAMLQDVRDWLTEEPATDLPDRESH